MKAASGAKNTLPQISGLCAILLLGFCLRMAGVSFGLPQIYHADEPIVVNHALAYGGGDLNPHFFKIPPLVSYFLFAAYGFLFVMGKLAGAFASAADFEKFFYADPSLFYLTGRILAGVIPGTFCIFTIFKLAEKYFSKKTAFASSLFLAVSFLHVRDSHYIYTDILLTFLILAAFFVFFTEDKECGTRQAVMSGILIGAACAVKYNGAALGIIYVIYRFLYRPKSVIYHSMLAAAAAGIVFICLNPFALLDSATFLREIKIQSQSQGGTPWLHHLTYSLAGAGGWAITAFFLTGTAIGVFSKDIRVKTLALFSLLYYVLLIKAGQPYDRYALPMIPASCLLAAWVWDRWFSAKRVLAFVILLALTAEPLAKAAAWDWLMNREDVRTSAKNWIEANLPEGSSLAMEWEFYMPRLNFSESQLLQKQRELSSGPHSDAQARKLDFLIQESKKRKGFELSFLVPDISQERFLFGKPVIAYDFAALKEKGVEYVLTAAYRGKTVSPVFFAELDANAEKIQTWSPYKNPDQFFSFDDQPLTGGPFQTRDIFSRRANGYLLTLYKLK